MKVEVRKYMLKDNHSGNEYGPFDSAIDVRDKLIELDHRIAGQAYNLASALIRGDMQDQFIYEMFLNVEVRPFFTYAEM